MSKKWFSRIRTEPLINSIDESIMGANFASEFKAAHPEEIGADGVVKVCIGGGAGFIGSHIAKKLMAEVMFCHDPFATPVF